MKINVFEGARRFAYLIGAIWAIGAIIITATKDIYVPLSYSVVVPSLEPSLMPPNDKSGKKDCSYEDASEWKYLTTAKGTQVRVELCFKAHDFGEGKMLIPYRVDSKGTVWGNAKYSNEVSTYRESVKNKFQLSKDDEQYAEQQYWPVRFAKWKDGALWLFGGWFAIWVFSAAVGWIVRGFAGIPQGMDTRPED